MKNKFTVYLLLISLILMSNFGTTLQAQDGRFSDVRTIADRDGKVRVIVKLDSTINNAAMTRSLQNELSGELRNSNATIHRVYRYIPYMAMTVDSAGVDTLARSSAVTGISQDIPMPVILNTSATQIGADGINGAWALGFTGRGQTVAVLDTGIDYTHSALADGIVAEACFGSSYTDSQYVSSPWCIDGASESTAPGTARECDLSYSGCNHGTHVAGIITANSDNYTGIAPDANIIAVQIFSRFDGSYCGSNGKCTLSFPSDQIAALEYIYSIRDAYNIAAVNMSLGGGHYTGACDNDDWSKRATAEMIALLYQVDIPVVISSGNSGAYEEGISAPACIDLAISVGAVDSDGKRAYFSQNGANLDLYAPGVSITSSLPDENYGSFNGTSMSAPHVSAAIALMREANPSLRVSDVLNILSDTGMSIYDAQFGYTASLIQVNNAIMATFDPAQLIVNGTFELESGKSTGAWVIINGNKEKAKCNKPDRGKYFAYDSDCAFMFKGGVDENSKLKQKAHLPSRDFTVGDTLTFAGWIDARPLESQLKIVVKVVYADNTRSKWVGTIDGASDGYQQFIGDPITLSSGDVRKIVTVFKHRSSAGKILIDQVQLNHTGNIALLTDEPITRTALEPVALPEAPDTFRD